jgi:hypothetical protein
LFVADGHHSGAEAREHGGLPPSIQPSAVGAGTRRMRASKRCAEGTVDPQQALGFFVLLLSSGSA